MAFVLSKSLTYSWPVVFEMPSDGGRFKKERFTVVFRRLAQSRIDDILILGQKLRRAAQDGTEDTEQLLGEARAMVRELVAGWEGIKEHDDDPEDLEFTDANLTSLLEFPKVAEAILNAYGESLQLGKAGN